MTPTARERAREIGIRWIRCDGDVEQGSDRCGIDGHLCWAHKTIAAAILSYGDEREREGIENCFRAFFGYTPALVKDAKEVADIVISDNSEPYSRALAGREEGK